MKKIHIIIYILLFSLSIQAQKYDEIIDLINQGEYVRAYPLLLQTQQKDPDAPNPYFQLGNISFERAITSNPLKNLEQTEYYIANTKLFYGLCIKKLNENPKDAHKNAKYYKTVEDLKNYDKLDNTVVISFLDKRLKQINKYDENIHQTDKYFNNFLRTYINSVNYFKQLIAQYPKINDLYLEQKGVIFKATNKLITSNDSTIAYYNLYKKSLDNTPEISYSPELVKMPIKLYRLEGLTRSDFLADTLYIWDYGQWAKNVQKIISTDINDLRQTIIKTNLKFNKLENKLKKSGYTNSYSLETLDQKVYFKIEKYDFNSIMSKLFYYRIAKINLLIYSKRNFNDTANYAINPDSRIKQFYDMVKLYQNADSLLNEFATSINEQNYKKHKDFFDVNYNGLNGLTQYAQSQAIELKQINSQSIKNILYITYRDILHLTTKQAPIEYKNAKISLKISNIDPATATNGQYYTKAIDKNKIGDTYVTGFYKIKNASTGFVAKISANQVVWMKILPLAPGALQTGIIIKASQEGCIVLLHNFNKGKHYNQIVNFSSDGKQLTNSAIHIPLMPRLIEYDDINGLITMAFHGTKYNYNAENSDSLVICLFDMNKKELLWKDNYSLKGNVIGLVKTDSIYNVYANYSNFTKGSTNLFNDKTNILHIKINNKGKFIDVSDLLPEYFNYGINTFKINAETMAILGFNKKINITNTQYSNLPDPYLIIFDKNDKIIFDSLEK